MTYFINKTQVIMLTMGFAVSGLIGCQTINNAPAPTVTKVQNPTEPILDLPITYELLGHYQWRLVSAVDSDYRAQSSRFSGAGLFWLYV